MIINGNKFENNNNLKYNNKEYLSKLQSGVIKFLMIPSKQWLNNAQQIFEMFLIKALNTFISKRYISASKPSSLLMEGRKCFI